MNQSHLAAVSLIPPQRPRSPEDDAMEAVYATLAKVHPIARRGQPLEAPRGMSTGVPAVSTCSGSFV